MRLPPLSRTSPPGSGGSPGLQNQKERAESASRKPTQWRQSNPPAWHAMGRLRYRRGRLGLMPQRSHRRRPRPGCSPEPHLLLQGGLAPAGHVTCEPRSDHGHHRPPSQRGGEKNDSKMIAKKAPTVGQRGKGSLSKGDGKAGLMQTWVSKANVLAAPRI